MSSSPPSPSRASGGLRPPSAAEQSFLGRLAGWCYDHRRRVLGLWILGIIALTAVSQAMGSRFQDSFSSGNSESQQVENILAARFPRTAGTTAYVVIHTTAAVDSPADVARTNEMVARLGTLPHVSDVTSPFAPGAVHQISSDGRIAFAVVQFDRDEATVANSCGHPAGRHGASPSPGPATTSRSAAGRSERWSAPKPGPSEGIGILAAMIIMLIAFGSVVAMGLPIMTALFGIAIGFALQDLLSHVLNVPIFAPEMLAMIGLGVGIDYALFIVTRYRQGLGEGRDPRQAVAAVPGHVGARRALRRDARSSSPCSGSSSCSCPFMQGLAVGAIAAVLLVMAAALTLLPAMLGFAGPAIDRLHLPGLPAERRRRRRRTASGTGGAG